MSLFSDLEDWWQHELFYFNEPLTRSTDPLPPYTETLCCQAHFAPLYQIPPEWWFNLPDAENFPNDEQNELAELDDIFGAHSHLLGWQTTYHSAYYPDDNEARWLRFGEGAGRYTGSYDEVETDKWLTLCQFRDLDEVYDDGMMAMGMGILLIHEDDLKAKDFSKTWFTIQGM